MAFVLLLTALAAVAVLSVATALAWPSVRAPLAAEPPPFGQDAAAWGTWRERFERRDDVAFQSHAALGAALCTIVCDPLGSSLQWLKAAAHARNPEEVARSAQGLRTAAQRIDSTAKLAEVLCPLLADGFRGESQRHALEQAGITCPAGDVSP
ncbi:MAG: hypothetical protein M3442_05640 [Chloroflexota bacterium]|nr:hypothetical protein [Chloroflexota bacterium]